MYKYARTRMHTYIYIYVPVAHIARDGYNESELCIAGGDARKSHVSLFLLLSDNRNCIHVTQSRRKLHKDRCISRASRNGPRQRNRANIHATYGDESVSALRLTHFCRSYLAALPHPRPITTLRRRDIVHYSRGESDCLLLVIAADYRAGESARQGLRLSLEQNFFFLKMYRTFLRTVRK